MSFQIVNFAAFVDSSEKESFALLSSEIFPKSMVSPKPTQPSRTTSFLLLKVTSLAKMPSGPVVARSVQSSALSPYVKNMLLFLSSTL